jgi:hypothetical protein
MGEGDDPVGLKVMFLLLAILSYKNDRDVESVPKVKSDLS